MNTLVPTSENWNNETWINSFVLFMLKSHYNQNVFPADWIDPLEAIMAEVSPDNNWTLTEEAKEVFRDFVRKHPEHSIALGQIIIGARNWSPESNIALDWIIDPDENKRATQALVKGISFLIWGKISGSNEMIPPAREIHVFVVNPEIWD